MTAEDKNSPAVLAVVKTMIAELDLAVYTSREDNAHQIHLRRDLPNEYVERQHVAILASNIQGVYTKTESLFSFIIENAEGKVPKNDSWHSILLTLAASPIDGIRSEIISKKTFAGLKEVLGFRHVVRSNYIHELNPVRTFEIFEIFISSYNDLRQDLNNFYGFSDAHHKHDSGKLKPR